MRFDLLRDQSAPNKFLFYEAYASEEAVAFHKTTEHYKVNPTACAAAGARPAGRGGARRAPRASEG